VTTEDIHKHGGSRPLHYYNESPSLVLQNVYPHHNWELERFKNKPRKLWRNKDNQKKFFDSVMTQLGYKCMDDWYSISQGDMFRNGGRGVLKYYNDSPSLALSIYPEHTWNLDQTIALAQESTNVED